MNYVLANIGKIPDYINYTINTILSVEDNPKIYLCTDQKVKFNNVEIVNINEIISEQTKRIREYSVYKKIEKENNLLLERSLLRIFYLRDFQKTYKVKDFVHFDNDVLIYLPFNKVSGSFDSSKFNISFSNNKRVVFGYSFIPSFSNFDKLCILLEEKLLEGAKNKWGFHNGLPPNEMDLMGMVLNENLTQFNLLPNLPYTSNIVFDPLGYGQYLDGTEDYPKKFYSGKYLNLNDIIPVELYTKRINFKFKNKTPFVTWNNNEFKMANLHIQSKRLGKFLPSNYKKYN